MPYTDEFEALWANYRRKEDKFKASKAFGRLSQKDKDIATNDCKKRLAPLEAQYVPLATTYINGKRFEDPPTHKVGSEEKPVREPVICSKCGEREVKIAGNINLCEICYVPPSNPVLERQREYYRDN